MCHQWWREFAEFHPRVWRGDVMLVLKPNFLSMYLTIKVKKFNKLESLLMKQNATLDLHPVVMKPKGSLGEEKP